MRERGQIFKTIPFVTTVVGSFLNFLLIMFIFYYFLFLTGSSVRAIVYPSIQWSSQNPIFHFTSEEFDKNQSYYKLSVLPKSSIYFVCPNPTNIFETTKMSIPKEELNENLWIVDKDSFETCNIDRNKTENKLLKQCIWNSAHCIQPYRKIIFQSYSGTKSGIAFIPGHEYYFISTSNGLKNSLNNTSGGHCRNKNKGISMRIIFYVCKDTFDCSNQLKNTTIQITRNDIPKKTTKKQRMTNILKNTTETTNTTNIITAKVIPTNDNQYQYLLSVETGGLLIFFGIVAGVSIILNFYLVFEIIKQTLKKNPFPCSGTL